jgi:PadR family transcriptional regulator, regulatory protein PadR
MARNGVLQGTLDLLVLKTVDSRGPIHGYGIATHIQEVSASVLRVEEGSLYPALHRLEQAGLITSAWRASGTSRRARFYQLTAQGRRELKSEEENWEAVTAAVTRVLQYT